MDDRRVGRLVRSARRRRGWRQVDVEAAAGVDQTTVSLIERGRLDGLRLELIRDVAGSVGVRLELEPRLPQAQVVRLLDEGHARLVEVLVGVLRSANWAVSVEYTFNFYGERGSVDVVGWRESSRTLLLIEVKSRLLDIQELLGTFDRKCRIVPGLLLRERGWGAQEVGRIIVVEDGSAARRALAAHSGTFDAAVPARSRDVRRWVQHPAGSLSGLWFMSSTTGGRTKSHSATPERVRRPRLRSVTR